MVRLPPRRATRASASSEAFGTWGGRTLRTRGRVETRVPPTRATNVRVRNYLTRRCGVGAGACYHSACRVDLDGRASPDVGRPQDNDPDPQRIAIARLGGKDEVLEREPIAGRQDAADLALLLVVEPDGFAANGPLEQQLES